ncbi:MAG: hypothetical protein HY731_03550 [Candidatus Tectomicrobia bacterium]|nr:hypothetical protein [Candidatus Tectomicrobia bacterium]
MNSKRVSVAEGKKEFTQLLKEAREKQIPILIFNQRLDELVGAILAPEEYEQYERLCAYFEALRLSQKFAHLDIDLPQLVRQSREELEERTL